MTLYPKNKATPQRLEILQGFFLKISMWKIFQWSFGSYCFELLILFHTSWYRYDKEFTRYKCPNGYMFSGGNYPYWYSNCTVEKVWDPAEVEACTERLCESKPPEGWAGIDVDWPKQNRKMGAKVTYTCPYRKATYTEGLSGMKFFPCQLIQNNGSKLTLFC